MKYQQQILGSMVMAAFFAGAVGCNRTADESVIRNDSYTTETTTSGTTTANDPATAPDTLANTGAVPPTDATMNEAGTTTTETKTTKKATKKHHGKKHKAKSAHGDGAWNERRDTDVYVYDDNSAIVRDEDDLVLGDDLYVDETVSGTTLGASTYYNGSLSPFAQEPASRIPLQIGSGQITGKDKSVSALEGASLFQDPSASERDRLNQ